MRAALTCLRDWRPDVVHAHDWLAAHAGIALADVHEVPLVATVHATEAGRNAGWLVTPLQRQVHSVEWWLARRADALITCSARDAGRGHRAVRPRARADRGGAQRDRAAGVGGRPAASRGRPRPVGPRRRPAARQLRAAGVREGRAGPARRAAPRRGSGGPGTRLVVVGTGTQRDELVARARDHGVADDVGFAGRLPDAELAAAVAAADAVVLPSRYEPFGIVALEAAAAGAPLVAARSGGLAEVVVRRRHRGVVPAGDVAALAGAVGRVLDDPPAAARRAARGRERLATDFAWAGIAERTVGVYAGARRRPPVPLGRPAIPEGDALAG